MARSALPRVFVRALVLALLAASVVAAFAASSASALGPNAMRPGFNSSLMFRNDDGSVGGVAIGFPINFFGTTYTHVCVNNNGNVTLDGCMFTYTPFPIVTTGRKIIAPFFADVDTRSGASAQTAWGSGTVDGRQAFGVTWPGVGCYNFVTHVLNNFQTVLINRSDVGAGDFDIEFNYDRVQWETGQASGGNGNCLFGNSVRIGYSNGTVAGSFELPGSAVDGAFLDSNLGTGLIHNQLLSDQKGRYLFRVRNGIVLPPTDNTPPVITPSVTGTLGTNGWYRSNVAVSFNVTDGESTVTSKTGCDPQSVTADTAGVTFTCTATSAGGTATKSVTVKRDATDPTVTFGAQSPAANANGWNNTDVSFPFTPGDNLSGVAFTNPGSAPLVLTAEGSAVSGAVTVTDQAGNSATYGSPAVQIDKTAPKIVLGVQSPAANANGWNNTDVSFSFTANDTLSGVGSTSPASSPLVLSAEGAAVIGTVSATDLAGNTTSVTSPAVKIDKVAPTITLGAASPSANANGWNNTDVSFSFTTTDSLSGVASSNPTASPLVLTAEGAAVTGTVSATDLAGNTSSTTSPAVKIDKTAPTASCSVSPSALWPPNHRMVPVNGTVTVTDGLSGQAGYRLLSATSNEPDNGLGDGDTADDIQGFAIGTQDADGSVRAERSGTGSGRVYTLTWNGQDQAGNSSAPCSSTVTVSHDRGR